MRRSKYCRSSLAWLLCAGLLAAGAATARPPAAETLLAGETMGSAWTVKIAGPLPLPAEELRAGIQERFEFVNQALSTYRVDSALSRFNLDDSGSSDLASALSVLVVVMIVALMGLLEVLARYLPDGALPWRR